MTECPQCHSPIEISDQNHGTLFTCPHCQTVYFVGWDGQPEGFVPAPQPEASEPPVETAAPVEEPTPENFSSGPDIFATTSAEPAVHVDARPNFADVVDFGNTPQLSGPLTYTVEIRGIEIADTRAQFKEAITDSKFGWDADMMLSQIQDGRITFYDLSPAKASVLIQRIKYLPLDITWRQNVLS